MNSKKKIITVSFNEEGLIIGNQSADEFCGVIVEFEVPNDYETFGLERNKIVKMVFKKFDVMDMLAENQNNVMLIDYKDIKELNKELGARLFKVWQRAIEDSH